MSTSLPAGRPEIIQPRATPWVNGILPKYPPHARRQRACGGVEKLNLN